MKKILLLIVTTAVLVSCLFISTYLIFVKIEDSKVSEIIVDFIITVLSGIFSALVAYGVAKFQINREKLNKIESQKKQMMSTLKLIKLEVEDNRDSVENGGLGNSKNMEDEQLIFKTTISSYYWISNSQALASYDKKVLYDIYIYYKTIDIIKNLDSAYLTTKLFDSFKSRQDHLLEVLNKIELKDL